MPTPKKVLYFAENALSAIQGGGIVAYAVLKGLPADHLLGFYDYRNVTPVPEYADRFVYLGPWRTPPLAARVNRLTRGWTATTFNRHLTELYIRGDMAFVERQVAARGFSPEAVYFSGLSYRYLRLAVLAAERYNVPMVILHMDDWMEVERRAAGPSGAHWARLISRELKRAAARSLVTTTNSPRLAARLTELTGYRHVSANNCCPDLMRDATKPARTTPNRIPIITYAGAMNPHLQGETLKVLASAVTELNAEGTRVQLHIYTPWEFAPLANAIAVPHAVFYKGQVGREQLADIYRRSDFLACTVTYREANIPLFRHSLSTKLSEYLCAGRPVISMGHWDWHLQEYVQDHGCGFSILMDENFSRATIKQQLRRILSTDPEVLARIGHSNRALWGRSHDVAVMARDSRRALGLETPPIEFDRTGERRGVLWIGDSSQPTWVPLPTLQAICRRLVDVFEHNTVDLIGEGAAGHPDLGALLGYCNDIGLRPTLVAEIVSRDASLNGWEPSGARWSLAAAERGSRALEEPKNVFAQVAVLRGRTTRDSPVERVINQLTVLVDEAAVTKPTVWMYGSVAIDLQIIDAIERHSWLSDALEIGGSASSPDHCQKDALQVYRRRAADVLANDGKSFIVVTSETARLTIQEELSRLGLLEQMVPAYGSAATAHVFERDPKAPGEAYVEGASARDYATSALMARMSPLLRASSQSMPTNAARPSFAA